MFIKQNYSYSTFLNNFMFHKRFFSGLDSDLSGESSIFFLNTKYYISNIFNLKKKNHSHHIPFFSQNNNIFNDKNTYGFFSLILKQIYKVPFYFSLVISLAGLFVLFFIFLQKKKTILNLSSAGILVNSDLFFIYYFSLIFYILLLVLSLYSFFVALCDEFRCYYIYTLNVENQCLFGVILFIVSEIMLFISFFWAFFHASLAPSIFIGNCWPPIYIATLSPWHLPFLNTLILLTSGITVNWFYFSLKRLMYLNIFSFYTDCEFFEHFKQFIVHEFDFLLSIDVNLNAESVMKSLSNQISKKLKNLLFMFFFSSRVVIFLMSISFINYFSVNSKKTDMIVLFFTNFLRYINFIFSKSSFSKFLKYFNSTVDKIYLLRFYVEETFEEIFISLILTIYLGFLFLGFQYTEYKYYATFDLDNIYGTVFYLLTSLHGTHVFIGLTVLLLCFAYYHNVDLRLPQANQRLYVNSLITYSVWYWHFVDVVWLFLFVVVYLWGS